MVVELDAAGRGPTKTTVVPTTTVWVLVYVVWDRAGQLVTVAAHEVTITVLVVRIVDVYEPSSAVKAVVVCDLPAAVTGQTVVETAMVSVVKYVDLAVGHFGTFDGHAVMVLV